MNSDACDNDADLWLNLLSRLQQGQKDVQRLPIHWHYDLDISGNRDRAASLWFRDEIQQHEPVLRMLDRWIEHGIVDDPSEELRWFLGIRFGPAIELVAQLTWSEKNLTPAATWTTFFPFPKLPVKAVLKTLLTDWWSYRGSHLFFDSYYDHLLLSKAAS